MIAILRDQKFAEGIPAGLPADAGVKIAHKTGWFGQVYHDAAIVEPPRGKPFVLVVLTRGIKETPRRTSSWPRSPARSINMPRRVDAGERPPRRSGKLGHGAGFFRGADCDNLVPTLARGRTERRGPV